ncbi:MAG: hypothetical protein RR998_01350 [Oscillospiraceae bacterium]
MTGLISTLLFGAALVAGAIAAAVSIARSKAGDGCAGCSGCGSCPKAERCVCTEKGRGESSGR